MSIIFYLSPAMLSLDPPVKFPQADLGFGSGVQEIFRSGFANGPQESRANEVSLNRHGSRASHLALKNVRTECPFFACKKYNF